MEVKKNNVSMATFVYDGDGRRVKSTINGTTIYFVGAHYEVTGSTVTKYYFAGAQRVAMRSGSTVNYLLTDHLGSTSLTTDTSGTLVSEMRYKPWGEVRYTSGTTPTNYTYTGQYSNMGDFGLMLYYARWYDPAIGRFAQADPIIQSDSHLEGDCHFREQDRNFYNLKWTIQDEEKVNIPHTGYFIVYGIYNSRDLRASGCAA